MKIKKYLPLIIGLLILFVFLLMVLFPTMFTSYSKKEMFSPWLSPDSKHILGTNDMGYDIFTEIVYGARGTLTIGLISSAISLFIGVLIGVLATFKNPVGYFFDILINVFMMLPKTITIIVIIAFIPHNTLNIILVISIFSWVSSARLIRMKVNHIYNEQFIENLRIQGYSNWHIIIHHIIPNIYDIIIARLLLGVNSCIMLESTLSFLGLGDLYNPTWGTMINFAYKRGAFLRGAYNYLLMPGVFIMLVSLAFYLLSLYFEHKNRLI